MSNGRHSFVAFYPSDWTGGTARMTRLHKSVYFDVCCYIWDKAEPCPAGELPLMLGDLANWRDLVEDLVAAGKLVRSPDGSLVNPKAIEEAEKAFDLWHKRSGGGKDGAAKTNLKRAVATPVKTPDNTPVASPVESRPGLPSQNLNQNQNLKEAAVDTREPENVSRETREALKLIASLDACLEAVYGNERRGFPHGTDMGTALKWVAAGYTLEFCEPVMLAKLRERAAKKLSAPSTLSFFNWIIADAKLAAESPMPEGKPNGQQRRAFDPEQQRQTDRAAIAGALALGVDRDVVAGVRPGEVPDSPDEGDTGASESHDGRTETLSPSEYRVLRGADGPADYVRADVQPAEPGCEDSNSDLPRDAKGPAGRPAGESDLGDDTGSQEPLCVAPASGDSSQGGRPVPVAEKAADEAGNGPARPRQITDDELVDTLPAFLRRRA